MAHRTAHASLLLLALIPACGGAPPPPDSPPVATPPSPPVAASAAPTAAASAAAPPRADTSLIPRAILFGNPDRTQPRISPDGKQLAFLSAVDGVLNVFVGPIGDLAAAKPVTHDKKRGIRSYQWAYTSSHVLYVQDDKGDENWHVYAVDLKTGKETDLTPFERVNARIARTSHKLPGAVLVAVNQREPKHHDLFRVDLATGKRTLVQENTEGFSSFIVDDDLRVRFADRTLPDGGGELLAPDGPGKWKSFQKIGSEDAMTTGARDFDRTGKLLYLVDSRGRNTAELTTVDVATGKQTTVASDPRADITSAMLHPTDKRLQAAVSYYDRSRWHLVDPAIKPDFEAWASRKLFKGEVEIVSRTIDDERWVVADIVDDGPVRYYLWDRGPKKETFLFTNVKALEGLELARMKPVVVKSRDGLDLVSYLSLPRPADPDADGVPDRPLPMVLFVHGGPWARDTWGLNPVHQWLASRGYAVLSVNYRGSTGFGKKFINAANREWAGKMHDDLIDAVGWVVAQKVADPQRFAILGGSYGGYSTLVGLTFTPETFACGVDIVGPSSLITLLENVPPYWVPMLPRLAERVGDHKTDEGRKLLAARSPLTHVAKIQRPLLIGQGANDPRVKQAESDQIVKAMNEKGIPVTYVLYPDEGHGFARPANRLSFFAASEVFLAQCLRGPYQPIGDDFKGSTIAVPAGVEHVHGLRAALP